MNKRETMDNSGYKQAVSGLISGIVPTLILHPLDLVKVRLQVNVGKTVDPINGKSSVPTYHGFTHAMKSIYGAGGWSAFYQGVTPNLLGNGLAWGCYFFMYSYFKKLLTPQSDGSYTPGQHMFAAAESGFATLIVTNPVWVAKTRMCLKYEGQAADAHYKSILSTWRHIVKTDGFFGLYKGFFAGVFGISHGAVQFMVYEQFKHWYISENFTETNVKLPTLIYLSLAATSKITACVVTYPYQVIKTRLQEQHKNYGGTIRSVCSFTWRIEGWRGFYKGLFPALLRVTPSCCLTFIIYENLSSLLDFKW